MTGGGKYAGHYHLETQEKTDEEMIEDTLKFIDDLNQTISRDETNVVKRIERQHDRHI